MTSEGGLRILPNWIDSFMEYTENIGVPEVYRKWCAIATISGVLERRVWTENARGVLYPNVWILLVGIPGIGKTLPISIVLDLWNATGFCHVAPSTITRAGFVDFLVEKPRLDRTDGMALVHSALIGASEFGNLVPTYDNDWLNVLNELYDCGATFQTMTRGRGKISADRPHVTLVAGTQPGYLANLLPETAFGMGFLSRFVMIYASEGVKSPLFSQRKPPAKLRGELVQDLQTMGDMSGAFTLTKESVELLESQYLKGFPPAPTHPKLQHYTTRRVAHILKLCMILSASQSQRTILRAATVAEAIETLQEAEVLMPEIFAEMGTKGFADVNVDCHLFVQKLWLSNGRKPVMEHKIVSFLSARLPQNQVFPTIATMERSGLLKKEILVKGQTSFVTYTPTMPNEDTY